MGDYADHPPAGRNVLWLLFTEPRRRSLVLDRESHAAYLVALFRSAWPTTCRSRPGATWPPSCAAGRRTSIACGARHDVAGPESRVKRYRHPVAGDPRMRSTSLWLADPPGARMVVHTPDDAATRDALAVLTDA